MVLMPQFRWRVKIPPWDKGFIHCNLAKVVAEGRQGLDRYRLKELAKLKEYHLHSYGTRSLTHGSDHYISIQTDFLYLADVSNMKILADGIHSAFVHMLLAYFMCHCPKCSSGRRLSYLLWNLHFCETGWVELPQGIEHLIIPIAISLAHELLQVPTKPKGMMEQNCSRISSGAEL
ncbi:hypothetical protein MKW98_006890 [Papaver atlanticum]|uniref:Uncharacterized protein n=1 Tax=Papaver atlanticum TaxID=357466 RepID=A0AAD4ST79_9MAGN|nr:hypothetical protein MKW98_006890 [Papaver atlanticum]